LRLPLSTLQFDYLTDRIRLAFNVEDQGYLRRIYAPEDDGAMKFISAEHEDAAGFEAFFRAVERARSKASAEPVHEQLGHLWIELLDLIRLDPRFSSEWE